jgi:hypothetical protein
MIRFHPIHYSFWLNVLVLVLCAGLALHLSNPLVFVIGLITLQHMVGRFQPEGPPAPRKQEPAIGFLANLPDDDDDDPFPE